MTISVAIIEFVPQCKNKAEVATRKLYTLA